MVIDKYPIEISIETTTTRHATPHHTRAVEGTFIYNHDVHTYGRK